MNSKSFIFIAGIIFAVLFLEANADGHSKDLTYAKLPHHGYLLSIDDFERYIVDRQMGEMYFALLKPPAFAPDINYKSTIVRAPGSSSYSQNTIGETPGANSVCARGNTSLTPVNNGKSLFYRQNDIRTVQAMWSSVPSKYIWSMRCGNYYPTKRKCLFQDTVFGVYIHGDLDDMPITMFEDLCKATGLKFGADNFKWFFSYGDNTLCVP